MALLCLQERYELLTRPDREAQRDVRYLVQSSNSLGELGLDLRQRLSPLEGLLELLLGFVQTLLELPVLLFALDVQRKD